MWSTEPFAGSVGALCAPVDSVTASQAFTNAWATAVSTGDGNSPNYDHYNHHIDSSNPCSTGWIAQHEELQSFSILQVQHSSIWWRTVLRCGLVQAAGAPIVETACTRLGEMAMLAPARVSSHLFAMALAPDSTRLEQSVELLLVPLDVWSPTGAVGTVVRVIGLVHDSATSSSLAVATVPGLRQPESPSN